MFDLIFSKSRKVFHIFTENKNAYQKKKQPHFQKLRD